MKLLGTIAVGGAILALNVLFVLWAFPDSIPGRLIGYFFSTDDSDGLRRSKQPVYRTFSCDNSLPEFTLDEYADPTEAQLDGLCSCIWKELPEPAKEFSTQLAKEKTEQSEDNVVLFSSLFGRSVNRCVELRTAQ